jgi:hypothetical protein
MKCLLIGCGGIGALHDWNRNEIASYAKAFEHNRIKPFVYDIDRRKSARVVARYGGCVLGVWDQKPMKYYDLVVISTPTQTHYGYLKRILKDPPRLIICEKPVTDRLGQLKKLLALYKKSKAKVLVNYHRRFQPKMKELSKKVLAIHAKTACRTIVITYQKGLLNNGSHAVDLLGFLFSKSFKPRNIKICSRFKERLLNDATVSLTCDWHGVQTIFVGLPGIKFSYFDVDLYFENKVLQIGRCGDRAMIFKSEKQVGKYFPKLIPAGQKKSMCKNPILNTLAYAKNILKDPSLPDNFEGSIQLAITLIKMMQKKNR